MLTNQVILKSSKGKKSNVYPVFPKDIVHEGNQIINKVQVAFREGF